MKIKLGYEINPDEEGDKMTLDHIMNAEVYYACLLDFYSWLRHQNKYVDEEFIKVDEVFERYCELLNSNGISF